MRPSFWEVDSIRIDLEGRDVSVGFVQKKTLASVCVEFRLAEAALETTVTELRRRAEHLARESVLDLASFLDAP